VKLKFFVIYLCAFIGPLGGNAVLALIPSLKSAFDVQEAEVMMAITLFMLPFAIGQLFTGILARKYNQQKIMVAGYIIYALGSFIAASAPDITIFLSSRVITGIGFAFVSPVTVSILGSLTVPQTRGRYMGLLNAAIGGGIFLGPIMAGSFALFDWRLTFYALGLLSLVVAYIFWLTYKNMEFEKTTASHRILGAELKSVLKSPWVQLLCIAGFITFFSFIGIVSITADHISENLDITEFELGLILASSGLAQIILALPGGLIVDYLGRYRTAYIGFASATIFAFFLIYASSFLHYIAFFVLLGFSAVLIWATLVTLSVEIIPTKKIYVTSVFNSLRFFGYAAAPIILVPIYTTATITTIYLICATTFAVGILFVHQLSR
jgi:MFS family permease